MFRLAPNEIPLSSRLIACLQLVCVAAIVAGWPLAAARAADPAPTAPAGEERPYKFGVFPYFSPLRLEAIYAPIGQAIGEAVGRPVRFRTASRFDLFFKNLEAGKYDVALIQPFWYVPAVDRFGYLPLARIQEPLRAMIVVLDEGPIRTLEDLRGTTLATPPHKGPVTRLVTDALREQGLLPGRDLVLKSYKSVDSCVQQVAIGEADACVSGHLVTGLIEDMLQVRLRVLMETRGIPNLSFVVHSRVPEEDRARLHEAIIGWDATDAGRALLKGMGANRFVTSRDSDFDVVRAMLREGGRQ